MANRDYQASVAARTKPHAPQILTLCWASLAAAFLLFSVPFAHAQDRPRVFVLTDIGNEPDDAESLVRFLLYTNEFDVEGIAATTSRHQREQIRVDLIQERVRAYGRVLANLRIHADGYPSMQDLLDRIVAGRAEYGMVGVGEGKDTDASNRLIAVVDRAGDERPVWVTVWGGALDLAQALWRVRQTRTPEQVDAFVSKLRVYSISDQDDAGPWIRREFPDIWWIVSLHANRRYGQATWAGISGEGMYRFDHGGPDSSLVSNEWLQVHVRKGPLGELYPPWEYIMEGDTPSFLYLIPNGLNSPEHPGYGGWGGRYDRVAAYDEQFVAFDNIFTDTEDWVHGVSDALFRSRHATIWRWREAYQHDFAGRIHWTLARRFSDANHNPVVVLNGEPGRAAVTISAAPGATVALSATGTTDPDDDVLAYRWFQYREAGAVNPMPEATLSIEAPDHVRVALPSRPGAYHFILEVKDDGELPLFAYRRAIVTVAALTQ